MICYRQLHKWQRTWLQATKTSSSHVMTSPSQDPPCDHLLPLRLELGQDAGQRSDLHAVALADAVPDRAVCKPQTQLQFRLPLGLLILS